VTLDIFNLLQPSSSLPASASKQASKQASNPTKLTVTSPSYRYTLLVSSLLQITFKPSNATPRHAKRSNAKPRRMSYAPVSANDCLEESSSFSPATTRANQVGGGGGGGDAGLQSHDHHVALRHTPTSYHHLEAARHLTWTDSFYDGKHGIIAAFDRDAATAGQKFMYRFLRSTGFLWCLSGLYWILGALDKQYSQEQSIMDDILGVYTLILGAFFAVMALRGRQAMLAQHVAVTAEGVRVDNGTMVTVTIPFEHVVKCIVAPYQFCCQTDPDFFTVTVQRAAAPLEQLCFQKTKSMELYGILRAQEFVDLVLAMKDSQDQGTYEGVVDFETVELQLQPIVPSSYNTNTDKTDGTSMMGTPPPPLPPRVERV
jgi:hypothetical protein